MRKNELSFFLIGVLSVLLIPLLPGCASPYKKSQRLKTMQITPALLQKFPDIPIPSNFHLQSDKSYAFMNADIRVGLLRYSGKAYGDDIVNFYKEQMPLYNWSLLNVVEYGPKVLNFEKGAETCSILVESKGKRSFIIISVNPKSRQSIKSKTIKTKTAKEQTKKKREKAEKK